MDHLNDTEIAWMVSGAGSQKLRRSLATHLAECEVCAKRVAACALALREVEPGEVVDGATPVPDALEEAGPCPPLILSRLRAAFLDARGQTGSRAREQVLHLVPWEMPPETEARHGGRARPLPLAAHAPSAGEDLPVLVTEDGQLRVRFRRAAPGGSLEAHLIAPPSWGTVGVSIQIPQRRLSFRLDREGTAALPGVTAADLTSGNLIIRLEPSRPMTEKLDDGQPGGQ